MCIARVVAVQPEVILMDESTSALDPIATLRVEELIAELKKEYTIVIVTHNMQQAARVSDHHRFVLAGRIGGVFTHENDFYQTQRGINRSLYYRQDGVGRSIKKSAAHPVYGEFFVYSCFCCFQNSSSLDLISVSSPVAMKIVLSQMFVTRSANRSRLWATQSSQLACSMVLGSAMTNVINSR